jgi:hypothetical protein
VSLARSAVGFVEGMSHCARERYSVRLLDERSGKTRTVTSPHTSYYADPFVFCDSGASWLFFEEFHCPANRGYIAAARIAEGLGVEMPVRVLDPGCHASFPLVFAHEGAVYLLPETSRARCVDLYVCDAMPDRWRRAVRLLEGVDCADSVLHRLGDLWYLITSQGDKSASGRRSLAIYCSETLLSQRWTPHPVNRERRYAERAHGYGRNAGAIVDTGTDLLRPMQASTDYYGEAASVMRIVELTPERYEEAPYEGTHVIRGIASTHSTHHISAAGGLVAWDTRTRAGYFRRCAERAGA